jgi:fructose-1,6-bisphosphatase/inositol monophosphatase family enzyme
MSGSLSRRRRERLAKRPDPETNPARALRYGCVGMEYVDLARGELHFAEYGILKPWDHAAGLLIHAEAGGYAAYTEDETAYRPAGDQHTRLLIAPDRQSWRGLRDILDSERKGEGS